MFKFAVLHERQPTSSDQLHGVLSWLDMLTAPASNSVLDDCLLV
jgi:hypothetical protein